MSRTERMTEIDERIVSAAEADLQQLLSIEPSPEFVARVHERIHATSVAPARRWSWIGLALASAAALILAALLRTSRVPGNPTVETVHSADIVLSAPPVAHDTSVPTSSPTAKVVRVARADSNVTRAEAPEIIIDPAVTDAIRRMAIALRNTAPDVSVAESLHVEEGDPAPLKVAEPLGVPELVVKPADQNGGDQNPLD